MALPADAEPLKTVFHRVNNLLPNSQELVVVEPSTPAFEAMRLMKQHGYSQLPVVFGKQVLGVFSYRSFARGIVEMAKGKERVDALLVEDFLEQLAFARVTDEIKWIFDELDKNNAVLVGDPNRLQGIATPMDALRYLYAVASPFVLVQEIELGLRMLIHVALEDSELITCIKAALARLYEGNPEKIPTVLEQMSFGEYAALIVHSENWKKFSGPFGQSRILFQSKLRVVNDLRNDIVHFRRKLTAEDYEALAAFREWILIRLKVYSDAPSE